MNEDEKNPAAGADNVTLTATDLKAFDEASDALHSAVDDKDDDKITEAASAIGKIVDKILGKADGEDDEEGNGEKTPAAPTKPDPFKAKMDKYAPKQA